MLSGEVSALSCALAFAVSGTIVASLARRMTPLTLIGWRGAVGMALYLVVLSALGRWAMLVHMEPIALLGFLADALVGVILGGTLFIRSLRIIGLSRAMPISSTYPVFATLMAAVAFDEDISWGLALAIPLVVAGVGLLASRGSPRHGGEVEASAQAIQHSAWRGVGMALGAAVLWAIGTNILKVAVREGNLLAGIFLENAALAVAVLILVRPKESIVEAKALAPRHLVLLVLSGIFENGFASALYFFAVEQAGVARTALLTSTYPLFALPLGLVFLRERITPRKLVGVVLCTLGTAMVFY